MKAKLIKDEEGYSLFTKEEGSNNRKIIATTEGIYVKQKLSKQNCDEIFGVVDVDKLAMGYELYEKINFVGQTRAYIVGFNKAMELNQDKVFTLEDFKKVIKLSREKEDYNFDGKDCEYKFQDNEIIQSLQQPTEIEVEIEMEDTIQLKKRAGSLTNMGLPKLDSEGCLILKRA